MPLLRQNRCRDRSLGVRRVGEPLYRGLYVRHASSGSRPAFHSIGFITTLAVRALGQAIMAQGGERAQLGDLVDPRGLACLCGRGMRLHEDDAQAQVHAATTRYCRGGLARDVRGDHGGRYRITPYLLIHGHIT